jgi:hypothetical protein
MTAIRQPRHGEQIQQFYKPVSAFYLSVIVGRYLCPFRIFRFDFDSILRSHFADTAGTAWFSKGENEQNGKDKQKIPVVPIICCVVADISSQFALCTAAKSLSDCRAVAARCEG